MGDAHRYAPRFHRWLATASIAVFALIAPAVAMAQGGGTAPPLTATIFFRNPPPGAVPVFNPTSPATPVTIVLQLQNVSGAPVFTTENFSKTEFWRRLFFTDPQGGVVTNTDEANIHRDVRIFQCFSRQRVLLRPTAIPVVPVEVLPGTDPPLPGPPNFFLEYVIDDARRVYNLTREGRYTVNARIALLTFLGVDPNAVINDCDQFEGETVVNVGRDGITGRREFTIVSNSLEFRIESDVTPPTTTFTRSPEPNAAGWNRKDVTLSFTAADNVGGSGVQRIFVVTSGAQTGEHILTGDSGSIRITTEGTTEVRFRAEDNAGNLEAEQPLVVRLDKRPPDINLALAPPPGPVLLNQEVSITFDAVDPAPGSGLKPGFPQGSVTFPGGTPQSITSPATITLDRVGTTVVTVIAEDVADNPRTTRTAEYTVGYRFVGFLSPIVNAACSGPPERVFKAGSTVPVKFQLFDAGGAVVGTARPTISATRVGGDPLGDTIDLGTGVGDTGNLFRFDPTAGQYIFNLDTKVLTPTGSWCITATLDDRSTHSVVIGQR